MKYDLYMGSPFATHWNLYLYMYINVIFIYIYIMIYKFTFHMCNWLSCVALNNYMCVLSNARLQQPYWQCYSLAHAEHGQLVGGRGAGPWLNPKWDEFVCVGEKDDDDVEILSWTSPASEGGEANNYTKICCFGSPAFFRRPQCHHRW